MTSVFDGMAGLLNDVFGGPVMHRPRGGVPQSRHWVFREPPVEVMDDDGHAVLDIIPILRVPGSDAASVSIGDQVEPGNGKTYRVINRQPSGSPAADAAVIFGLELVS